MQVTLPLSDRRAARGRGAYFAGRAAERSVARHLIRQGLVLLAERWRGMAGEIDLILLDGDVHVFVEVKQARSVAQARHSLRETQVQRIHLAASEYLGQRPLGQLSETRFDLALVDGTGQIEIVKNAFGHF